MKAAGKILVGALFPAITPKEKIYTGLGFLFIATCASDLTFL